MDLRQSLQQIFTLRRSISLMQSARALASIKSNILEMREKKITKYKKILRVRVFNIGFWECAQKNKIKSP